MYENLLKDTKHAKGKRLNLSLPLNGQRTKTNAKTFVNSKKHRIKKMRVLGSQSGGLGKNFTRNK